MFCFIPSLRVNHDRWQCTARGTNNQKKNYYMKDSNTGLFLSQSLVLFVYVWLQYEIYRNKMYYYLLYC